MQRGEGECGGRGMWGADFSWTETQSHWRLLTQAPRKPPSSGKNVASSPPPPLFFFLPPLSHKTVRRHCLLHGLCCAGWNLISMCTLCSIHVLVCCHGASPQPLQRCGLSANECSVLIKCRANSPSSSSASFSTLSNSLTCNNNTSS